MGNRSGVSAFADRTRWHGDTVTAGALHLPWSMPPSCFRYDFYARLNGDRAILVYNRFKRENRRRYVCARPVRPQYGRLGNGYTLVAIANGILRKPPHCICNVIRCIIQNTFRDTSYGIYVCVCVSRLYFASFPERQQWIPRQTFCYNRL